MERRKALGLIAATGAAAFTAAPSVGAETGRSAGAARQGKTAATGGYA